VKNTPLHKIRKLTIFIKTHLQNVKNQEKSQNSEKYPTRKNVKKSGKIVILAKC
jgi:hypothetical protein